MLFNSVTFIVFHILCVALYWATQSLRIRQLILLASSFVFYGWLYWPALFLLGASTIVNYFFSRWIDRSPRKREILAFAVTLNLSNLAWFKYSSFIGENLVTFLAKLGLHIDAPPSSEWLPLGISFYTFQVIGYLIDIGRGRIKAEKSILAFSVFKCFYAQLIAGPIVRAATLIPQINEKRRFHSGNFQLGIYLVIAGLAMKICIADTLAQFVDYGFEDPSRMEIATAWLTLYGFAAQILCDFWGYSTVAIGLGLMYGIRLPLNFNLPYFATSVREFWHRWHITLSEWLRDYLYIPLGGNRRHPLRNLFLTMLLGGIWHGASWNFLLWGAGHGLWLILERVLPIRLPGGIIWKVVRIFLVFNGVSLLWVLFRAPDLPVAIEYFRSLLAQVPTMKNSPPDALIFGLVGFIAFVSCLGKSLTDRRFLKWGLARQVTVCVLLILLILSFADAKLDFIYFVF